MSFIVPCPACRADGTHGHGRDLLRGRRTPRPGRGEDTIAPVASTVLIDDATETADGVDSFAERAPSPGGAGPDRVGRRRRRVQRGDRPCCRSARTRCGPGAAGSSRRHRGLADRPAGTPAPVRPGRASTDRRHRHRRNARGRLGVVPPADRRAARRRRDLRLPDRADPGRPGPQTPPGPRLADPPRRPGFFIKAAAVCDLYLHQPAGSIVVCVDEKTAIGARSRKHPEQRAAPGRAARREFEYIRHGTVSIIAALDVHTGQVITEAIRNNNSATFISFLTMLDQHLDPALTIHLVLDNGSSHTSKATRKWLATRPRSDPPHPQTRILARPGRTVLLDPDPQAPAPRRVHLPPGPRRQDRKLHHRLQPHSQALPLDLRRPAPQSHLTPEGLTRRCTSDANDTRSCAGQSASRR